MRAKSCSAADRSTIGSTRHAIELGIATVYQELSLLPNLTVAQNIALGREPRRFGLLDVAAMRRTSDEALARIGLAIPAATRVGSLSLAERQLVEIAKALADAPTRADPRRTDSARSGSARPTGSSQSSAGCRAEGIAIIYVSHRFAEILDLCDRATVLRNGRVVTTTGLAGWTEARLTEAMIGGGSEIFVAARRAGPASACSTSSGLGWQGACARRRASPSSSGEILALTGLLGAGQNEIGAHHRRRPPRRVRAHQAARARSRSRRPARAPSLPASAS